MQPRCESTIPRRASHKKKTTPAPALEKENFPPALELYRKHLPEVFQMFAVADVSKAWAAFPSEAYVIIIIQHYYFCNTC
jgi:hypothetical protein